MRAMLRPSKQVLSGLSSQQRPTSDHPDADVLQAFAEQRLSNKERAGLLSHLARCPDCRDVVSLVAQAAENASLSEVSTRHSWRNWKNLRWTLAPLAAMLVLLLVWPKPQPSVQNVEFHSRITPKPTTAAHSAFSRSAEEGFVVAPKLQRQEHRMEIRASVPAKKVSPPPTIQFSQPALAEKEVGVLAQVEPLRLGEEQPMAAQKLKEVQQSIPESAPNEQLARAREEVRARLATRALTPATPDLSSNSSLLSMTNRAAPGTRTLKSFSSLSNVLASPTPLSATPGSANRWRLAPPDVISDTPAGTLFKSQDSGQTWTPVQVGAGTRFNALAIQGSDVWAGGEAGALFHSADGGTHWTSVRVTTYDGHQLDSTITRIDTVPGGLITLKVRSDHDWNSVDNGRHWTRND